MIDLFSEYSVMIGVKISLPYNRLLRLDHTYFMYHRSQVNFALFASTTALGVAYLHRTKGDNLIKPIYRFHIYYQLRRILNKLDCRSPMDLVNIIITIMKIHTTIFVMIMVLIGIIYL